MSFPLIRVHTGCRDMEGAFGKGRSVDRRLPVDCGVCEEIPVPSVGWKATRTLTLTETFGATFVVGLCISILQRNRTNGDIKGDLWGKLAHRILEAEESHDLPSASRSLGKASGNQEL